jgi:propanol-preferring alcohol dehydrogenase
VFCRAGRENLCRGARFTGYDIDGGDAECALADARFCFPLPAKYDDCHAAPLLCAGLIGYRAYRMAGLALDSASTDSVQLLMSSSRWRCTKAVKYTRSFAPGDDQALRFAREVGATWAGPSNEPPPVPLDAALIFAPVGPLVPEALSRTVPGGVVVCASIHMSDIPSFP